MRWPRARSSARGMMIAVAVMAPLFMAERARRQGARRRQAERFERFEKKIRAEQEWERRRDGSSLARPDRHAASIAHIVRLKNKYRDAVSHPFDAVAPDPPGPPAPGPLSPFEPSPVPP